MVLSFRSRGLFAFVVMLVFFMLAVLASPNETAPHTMEEATLWP